MTEAEQMVQGYGGPMRGQLLELAENIVFMRHKLAEEREVIANQHPFVVETVGEKNPHPVVRPNKAFAGYQSLVAAHASAVAKLDTLLTKAAANQAASVGDPLAAIAEAMRDG